MLSPLAWLYDTNGGVVRWFFQHFINEEAKMDRASFQNGFPQSPFHTLILLKTQDNNAI
jgi:hypothetical protein